jgi:hypothetical protein
LTLEEETLMEDAVAFVLAESEIEQKKTAAMFGG